MPRSSRLDPEDGAARVLGALRLGPMASPELQRRLGWSQPTIHRLLVRLGAEVVRIGRGASTRYAARRHLEGVHQPLSLHEVDAEGRIHRRGALHAVVGGTVVEPDQGPAVLYPGIPWFLDGGRPKGFLGRLAPALHPELELPADVAIWQDAPLLRYWSRAASDLPGNWVVGDAALQRALEAGLDEHALGSDFLADALLRAEDALHGTLPGSSAGGERPKFLARRADGTAVLVKFSPPLLDRVAQRVSDLLVCEHLCLEALAVAGVPVARTRLWTGPRTFLVVERFDRVGRLGRRGFVHLEALAGEHGAPLSSWTSATAHLVGERVVPASTLPRVRLLEQFGRWVANTDMHGANLAFWLHGLEVGEACPAFDMSPMAYAPRGTEVIDPVWTPRAPLPDAATEAARAFEAALAFWERARDDERISQEFRQIAGRNREAVGALQPLLARLPS